MIVPLAAIDAAHRMEPERHLTSPRSILSSPMHCAVAKFVAIRPLAAPSLSSRGRQNRAQGQPVKKRLIILQDSNLHQGSRIKTELTGSPRA